MQQTLRFLGVVLLLAATPVDANAQTVAVFTDSAAVAMTGKIVDARNMPIGGAVITARGAAVGWTATAHDGSYRLSVPPGSYEVLVRKGGYTPSSMSVVLGTGASKTVSLTLSEANLSSVNTGSVNAKTTVPFNTGVSATATLDAGELSERPNLSLRDLALELPGLTLAHPSAAVPDTSFVVRGGTEETRVQIDGHAVSAGATGRWNSSLASLPLFDSIELVKGPAVSGANAGESAFGTVNLRTRDFSPGQHADVAIGADSFGGQYSTFAFSGNAAIDRLSYVFEHNVYGYNGVMAGVVVNNVAERPNGTALLADRNALTSPLMLGSDLAKLRWRFSSNTSLSVGYIGMHSEYYQTGGTYGLYDGERAIVPSAPALGATGLNYSSPQYPGLIGSTVDTYSFAHNTLVQTNQPLFEAELRTAIKNDTLLVRPYVATIFNLLDGTGRTSGADTSNGGAWMKITSGPGCSSQSPCFVPQTVEQSLQQEVDRLHGTTVSLIHPFADATLNLSYDYHSDQTSVAGGDPRLHFNGTLPTLTAYLPIIPTSVARTSDWSLTYSAPLSRRLRLFAGDYYTDWNLHYGSIVETVNIVAGTASMIPTVDDRTYRHNDPHVGVTWRPQNETAVRLSAGSAVTVPYANLVAGGNSLSGFFTGYGVQAKRNPNLQPESTVAYDLGLDHRFRNGSVVAADAFDNIVHNVFATESTPFDNASVGIPPGSPISNVFAYTTRPINAPLEQNYGLELAVAHAPVVGMGYRVSATLQRAFLAQLPASFYSAATSLVNGKQLDGSTSIPYAQAYGELNFRSRTGFAASLGATYTGNNNWTNGPAFTVWSSMLRYDFHNGYRAQFSIENLFNCNTGNEYAAGTENGGFASVNYGTPSGGGLPIYGATPTTRFAIAPRTFRFQVEAHIGH